MNKWKRFFPYTIKSCNYCNWSSDCACNSRMCADALDYIQQLENHIGELTEKVAQLEAAQPKWISVEERLPEEGETVLCYYESDLMGVCTRLHEIWEDSYGYWESDDAITHWMPLPEPPKEVEM